MGLQTVRHDLATERQWQQLSHSVCGTQLWQTNTVCVHPQAAAAAAAAAKSFQSCQTLCDPIDARAHQAPPSLGFSRQEHRQLDVTDSQSQGSYRATWGCPVFHLFVHWSRWVFVAAHGLSLAAASRAALCCGAWASHCRGFSCCGSCAAERWLQELWHRGLLAPR